MTFKLRNLQQSLMRQTDACSDCLVLCILCSRAPNMNQIKTLLLSAFKASDSIMPSTLDELSF